MDHYTSCHTIPDISQLLVVPNFDILIKIIYIQLTPKDIVTKITPRSNWQCLVSTIYLSISFLCSRKIECQRGMDSWSMRMWLGTFKLDSPKFHPAVSNLNKKSSNLFSISDKLCFSQWTTLSLFSKLSSMFSYNQYACQRHLNTSLLVAFTCIIGFTEIK